MTTVWIWQNMTSNSGLLGVAMSGEGRMRQNGLKLLWPSQLVAG